MKSRKLIRVSIVLGICLGSLQSCKDEASILITEEPTKDIAGTWKVIQITRNGEDLSKRMRFDDFQIEFKADGSYALSDALPFIVDGPGNYQLNDPKYPFSLILKPTEGGVDLPVKFLFPIVDGERQLSLNMSLGCSNNSYQYTFQRVSAE